MEIVLTMAFFGMCMAGMGIGALLQGRFLRGSCGGPDVITAGGEAMSCGACPKQERDLCPTDNQLVAIAQIGHPDPDKHR
jgi:hypothetical protein